MDPIFVTIGNILLLEWVGLRGGHLVGRLNCPPPAVQGSLELSTEASRLSPVGAGTSTTEDNNRAENP